MGIGKLDLTDVKEILGFHGVQYKEGVLYIKCEDSGKRQVTKKWNAKLEAILLTVRQKTLVFGLQNHLHLFNPYEDIQKRQNQ